MASFARMENRDIKTGAEVKLDPQRAAASRCFALLFTVAETCAQIQRYAETGKPENSATALGELVHSLMFDFGGAGQIDLDARTLAKMIGCQVQVEIERGSADAAL